MGKKGRKGLFKFVFLVPISAVSGNRINDTHKKDKQPGPCFNSKRDFPSTKGLACKELCLHIITHNSHTLFKDYIKEHSLYYLGKYSKAVHAAFVRDPILTQGSNYV